MREKVNVIFRKFRNGDVIAFIDGYDCAPGLVMSYEHVGQHGEASIDLIDELKPCVSTLEYAPLANELISIGYDVTVVDSFE